MHYLETGQYTYLAGEINALYHEAAVKMGISDSVQNILYVPVSYTHLIAICLFLSAALSCGGLAVLKRKTL